MTHQFQLIKDGRKTPDYYRRKAFNVSTPSQLSIGSITESYQFDDARFKSTSDVLEYRGYKLLERLDEGAFGVVSKAMRYADMTLVAVKEVDMSRRRAKRIEEMKRELFVLQRVDSPYVVHIFEHFIFRDSLLCIVMELCAGGNLTTYLKDNNIEEDEARSLFRQMALAVRVLHKRGIAHRDVKLNNFLLDESRKNIKIADFGLSVVAYKRDAGILYAKSFCGTEPYMAPELLRRNSQNMRLYNPIEADIWALGICLYAMLTRTFPFKAHSNQGVLLKQQIFRRWRFPRDLRETISEDLKDLICHLLDPECERRITIVGVLTHPWLNQNVPVASVRSETPALASSMHSSTNMTSRTPPQSQQPPPSSKTPPSLMQLAQHPRGTALARAVRKSVYSHAVPVINEARRKMQQAARKRRNIIMGAAPAIAQESYELQSIFPTPEQLEQERLWREQRHKKLEAEARRKARQSVYSGKAWIQQGRDVNNNAVKQAKSPANKAQKRAAKKVHKQQQQHQQQQQQQHPSPKHAHKPAK